MDSLFIGGIIAVALISLISGTKGEFIMDSLFIGTIIAVVLISLISRKKGNITDSRNEAYWDNVEKVEQDIQRARGKLPYWGFPIV